MIRQLIFAAILALGATPAAAAAEADDIVAAVNAYNDALNKNDVPGAAGFYAPSPAIIDEFTPHVWTGAAAFQQWGADYGTYAAAQAMSEPSMVLAPPLQVRAEADRGYAVFPATFNFKRKGAPDHEDGLMTFAMQKIGGAWKIAGWSWSLK
ncbi:MAG: nuclear transport factor 2 family protein [Rhizomicrobium sp.]